MVVELETSDWDVGEVRMEFSLVNDGVSVASAVVTLWLAAPSSPVNKARLPVVSAVVAPWLAAPRSPVNLPLVSTVVASWLAAPRAPDSIPRAVPV